MSEMHKINYLHKVSDSHSFFYAGRLSLMITVCWCVSLQLKSGIDHCPDSQICVDQDTSIAQREEKMECLRPIDFRDIVCLRDPHNLKSHVPDQLVSEIKEGTQGSLYKSVLGVEIVRRPLLCPGKVGGHKRAGFGNAKNGPLLEELLHNGSHRLPRVACDLHLQRLGEGGQVDGSGGAPQRSPELQGISFAHQDSIVASGRSSVFRGGSASSLRLLDLAWT